MKTVFLVFFGFFFLASCAQKTSSVVGETEFQREINSEYKDASKSPLKAKDLKKFEG
jgi:hypothetical protein